jgi:hypothetical protein
LSLFIKAIGFSTVAAIAHVAPAPAFIAAGVQKKPSAGQIAALFNPL